tara:strand:+ start:319 stop:1614 length:1296 start_codon:yes stop_codon:yes gene_type:complete
MAHNLMHFAGELGMNINNEDSVVDEFGNIVPSWMRQPATTTQFDMDTTSYNQRMPSGGVMSAENQYQMRNPQNAVSGGSTNNMKIGMNASQQAQQNLANIRDIVPGSVKMASRTPQVDNVQMQYQTPELSNIQTVYDSRMNPNVQAMGEPDLDALSQRIEDYNMMNKTDLSLRGGADSLEPMTLSERPGSMGFISDSDLQGILSEKPDQNLLSQMSVDQGGLLGKAKDSFGKAKDFVANNSTMQTLTKGLSIGAPIAQGISKIQGLSSGIESARGMRDSLQSTISGLAPEKQAYQEQSDAMFSENRRQVGELSNQRLDSALSRIKNARTGNLVSGSQQEQIEDTIDDVQSRVNINIANEFTKKLERDSAFNISQNNRRSQLQNNLEAINAQIKQMEKDRAFAPIDMALNVGIAAMGPAGLPLQLGKQLLLG